VEIIGVSFDSPEENQSWAAGEGYQYELWTDESRTLALTYGAASSESASIASRITVLLDAEGNLALTYAVSDIGTHPALVLEDCQTLFGGDR
jgi:peroxiredoxin Q/BCP